MSFSKDLLAFMFLRGSRPNPDNIAEPLPRRVGRKCFAVVNYGFRGVRVGTAQFRRGKLHIDDVVTFPRELNDRDLGDGLTPEMITAIKDRSPKGIVVVGLSTRVTIKTVDFDSKQVEQVRELHGAASEDDSERATYLWQENGQKMIRMATPTVGVRSLERALSDEGLHLYRLLFTPHALLNGYLSYFESTPAPASSEGLRLLTILDDSHIQALTIDRTTGMWRQLRAIPVFSVRLADGGAASRPQFVELLRDFVRSLHRDLRPSGPLQLAVLNTGIPQEGWGCLEEAVTSLNQSKELQTPVKLNRELEGSNIDLHALCLHP